ncbi:MAG: inverse autotransporter beta domain-containing protein [Chloroflexota bacterium]|nr:inverse autotransporter beta domain-containing protein [Chloroflexota bacterium]
MHLSDLLNYHRLTDQEKLRLHQLHEERVRQGYNVEGEASISPQELSRANDPDPEQVDKEVR